MPHHKYRWADRTLFSTLRNNFFLPISYSRRDLPMPATNRPWKAKSASGTSSVSVYISVSFTLKYYAESGTNLMQQLQPCPIVREGIRSQVPTCAGSRRHSSVRCRPNDQMQLVLTSRERNDGDREYSLVAVDRNYGHRRTLHRIDNSDVCSPSSSWRFRSTEIDRGQVYHLLVHPGSALLLITKLEE